MAAAKLTFRHAFLLLCISHSSVTSFSPLASVRLTPIRSLGPSKVLAPDSIITINYINTRTCPRRHHAEHRSTRLQLSSSASLSWVYMSLLALQFGIQPILTKKFTPKTITRTTVVLCQDIVKFLAATIFLWASGSWTTSLQGWSVRSWWIVAGIPAALYVVQNYCALMAYQNLPPITFNVLNQTKTLSAALCCFLILGRVQSPLQIVSLFLLLLSALVIEKVVPLQRYSQNDITTAVATKGDTTPTTETVTTTVNRRAEIVNGVIPVLLASFLSGLAGALSQKSLQTMGRDSYLFTMELSAASLLFMTFSLVLSSPDGKRIRRDGFFHGWTIQTWIPVITNALGGIIVGLVTKYAGSVRKGFALIFGLLLSGILQSKGGEGVEKEQVVGGILAAISLWMYSSFPVAATI